MNTRRRNMLSILDNALRWTGIPDRIADEMSDAPSVDPEHHRLRWSPMLMIAASCALFILSLTWRPAPNLPLLLLPALLLPALGTVIIGLLPVIYIVGPLGKSSFEDDEREAALRKDCFLFCLGLLALLNCVGQPFLMVLPHLQNWQPVRITNVASSVVTLNATLFACLPTLYASWHLRQLPKD